MLVGIDIGGTKTVIAIGNPDGQRLKWVKIATNCSGDAVRDLTELSRRARAFADEHGIAWSSVRAGGVSVPGPLDVERGVVLYPPNLPGWGEVAVVTELERRLDIPFAIENDANAAALAEWRFGAGRGAQDVVYLTMSTGIGGGIVLGGRLQRGLHSGAGEVGHVPIEWDGLPCACGQRGCLEAYVGGAAWAKRLAEETPADSAVLRHAGTQQAARPEHVVAAAREGDPFALSELARFNHYLSWGIIQIAYTLAPEVVVLGTIPTHTDPELCLEPVRETVKGRIWPFVADSMRIEVSALRDELPAHAGICVAMNCLARGDGAVD